MSLGIVIKGPEGIVLAAESRVTLTHMKPGGHPLHVNFDNATKVLAFSDPNVHVGAVTYGMAAIGIRTVSSFLPEFEAQLPTTTLPVLEFATQISQFFIAQWAAGMPLNYTGPNITIVVAGFDVGEPYGKVFLIDIPARPTPVEQSVGGFGFTWGGQRDIVDRLVQGFDNRLMDLLQNNLQLPPAQMAQLQQTITTTLVMPFPVEFMALQDYIDMALFFIRTTIAGQKLTVGIRGCGGPIDVATITRSCGFNFVQRKTIKASGNSAD
jgi:hypothetical protein